MRKRIKFVLPGLVAILVLVMAACPKRVSIAEIEANPAKYENKEIAIAGVVRDSFGVSLPGTPVRGGVYKIDDGTGTMWVLTDESVPSKGAEVGVKGRIGSGVTWRGRNYGLGMFEKSRKFRKR